MLNNKYYIQKIYQPAADLVVIEVGDKRGLPVFNFKPGQYAMISYTNQNGQIEDKHAFSIASSPTEKNLIRFGIKVLGSFTKGLLQLKEGDELIVSGPFGKFIYDENKYSNAVLIAGGIGVTPFVSSLQYATDLNLNNNLSLIYSARTTTGAAFREEIINLKNINPHISTLFSFTEEPGESLINGVLHKRLNAQDIKNFIGITKGKTFFICGPAAFMGGMYANLLSLGVEKNQIEMEEFSMTPDQAFLSRLKNISYSLSFAATLFVISFILLTKVFASSTSKQNYSTVNTGSLSPIVVNTNNVSQPVTAATPPTTNSTNTSAKPVKAIPPTSTTKPLTTVTPSTPVQVVSPAPVQPVTVIPTYTPPAYTPPVPTTRVS